MQDPARYLAGYPIYGRISNLVSSQDILYDISIIFVKQGVIGLSQAPLELLFVSCGLAKAYLQPILSRVSFDLLLQSTQIRHSVLAGAAWRISSC